MTPSAEATIQSFCATVVAGDYTAAALPSMTRQTLDVIGRQQVPPNLRAQFYTAAVEAYTEAGDSLRVAEFRRRLEFTPAGH